MSYLVPQVSASAPQAGGAATATNVPQANLMGGLSKAFPQIATSLVSYGDFKEGIDRSNADRYNAGAYATEAGIASAQGFQQEAQQRRTGSLAAGRETAAIGAAGAGYGGSAGRALEQSALSAELDAQSIRYKAQLQRWAYGAQAQNLQADAKAARTGAFLKAGSALLTGFSPSYTSP